MQLNLEQKRIIQSKPSGHVMIKGVAGSGKTTVAVHRIPFLLNYYCFGKDDSILMVTYNKILINYIKYIYEKVDEESRESYISLFAAQGKDKLNIETIDGIMFKYFNEYRKENKFSLKIIDDSKKKYPILSECISEISKLHSDVRIIDQKYAGFLLDEIDWIKSCNYMELEEYQNADRVGRTNKQNSDGPQKLMKNSDTRRAIFELMKLYNKRLSENGYIDFKDVAYLAYKQAQKKVMKKYTHIIIDESQDLTRVQLEFLRLLLLDKEYSSIMFVCDTAQSIYSHSWLIKGRSFTSIGFDMTGKSSSLSKNYRTTTQIAEAAYSLIENDDNIIDDENFVKPSLIDRQGSYPVCRYFNGPDREAEFVISEINNNLINKYEKKDIVIIAKKKSLLRYIKDKMDNVGIESTIINKDEEKFEDDNVKLMTMHSIKGLEFKAVFIIGMNKDIMPYVSYQGLDEAKLQESGDRKLLYVGMTRANELLYITSSGVPSKFFDDINHRYLLIDTKSKMRRYCNIGIDEYEFKNDIIDIYSNEEKVRQWCIRELMETYKYPRGLIDVEFKVNNFSKTGSVDICVSIYSGGNKIPYIFVETKAFGSGIEGAIRQVKSYMSSCETCQYGIAVDGNEVMIINKRYEAVDDIPMFNPSMLPSSIENYKYIDMKSRSISHFTRDRGNIYDVVVKNSLESKNYKDMELIDIPIYGNIAAGKPIYMAEQMEDKFSLPRDWFRGDEYYILKIKGDSMIGAGIDDGDYVVIKKQETASNRDIVAVSDEDSATLKRFLRMGDSVLLVPENEKYEAIQLRCDQVNIQGVAVGILKSIKQNLK